MTPSQAVPTIVARQIPAGADVDQATWLTIAQMAEYIRQSMHDPLIQEYSRRAVETFGQGCQTDQAKAWAVFWWIKHAIKFESDENTLLRLGRRGEQDLLIAPSVLVRMRQPKEDCDGFAQLAACMLACLGVRIGLAAVAVDPDEPERWSHVFCLAQLDGEIVPIDASHGFWPGWMVPRSRISRWQAFDLNGRAVDVPMPRARFKGLHGYVRRGRGMGNMICDEGGCYDDGESQAGTVISFPQYGQFGGAAPAPTTGGPGSVFDLTFGSGGSPTTSGGSGSAPSISSSSSPQSQPAWLGALVNNSFGLASKILAPNYQSTYVRDPLTGQLVQSTTVRSGPTPGASLFSPSTGNGVSPVVLIGGLGLLVVLGMSMVGSKGR